MYPAESTVQRTSAEMLESCASQLDPKCILRSVLSILRRLLPFDVASYSEYHHGSGSSDPPLVRYRFAIDGEEEFRWPARWIQVPPRIVAWVEGDHRWIPNLDAFHAELKIEEPLRQHVVTQEYQRRGIASFLVAPHIDGGRAVATLSLGRRQDRKPFKGSDQKLLDALRLPPILRQVGNAFDKHTEGLAQELSALFTPQSEPIQLAKQVVIAIAKGFDLEYVGLFRVNRTLGRFDVLAEVEEEARGANPVQLKLPENYTQAINEGMLSKVLKEGRELYAPNVRTIPPPYGYKSTSAAQASALCIPISLRQPQDTKIQWILDLESSQLDAFPEPDQKAIKKIVSEIERSLPLWFEARLCSVLLNLVNQGVVVLEEGTRIERANDAARSLLGIPRAWGLPSDQKFGDFENFAADAATRQAICGGSASSDSVHLRLKGYDGVERPAIAGGSYRDEAFHRRVWLLSDVANEEWVGALRYMETAVSDVAAQAHGRLLLTRELLRKARTELGSQPNADMLLDRAIRNITTADLTYERISSLYDILTDPLRQCANINLAEELRRFRNSLSDEDARSFKLKLASDDVIIEGDQGRLGFAIRSLLGYLLTALVKGAELFVSVVQSCEEATIDITLSGADGAVLIAGLLNTQEDDARTSGAINYAESRAHAASSHAIEAVRKVIEAHGGKLSKATNKDGDVHISISGLRHAIADLRRN